MEKYTMSQLNSMGKCDFRGFMSTLNQRGEDNLFLHLLPIYKNAMIDKYVMFLNNYFDDNVSEKYFYSEISYEEERKLFVINIKRFKEYLEKNNGKIIRNGGSYKHNFQDTIIESRYDMIVEYPDRIDIVKIKNTQPKLSYSARSEANKVENNYELYFLQKTGELIINDKLKEIKPLYGAFYHIKGKEDKGEYFSYLLNNKTSELEHLIKSNIIDRDEFYFIKKKREGNKINTQIKKMNSVLNFNGNDGSNILKCDEFNMDYILKELSELVNKKINVNSERNMNSKHCDTCPNKVICMDKNTVKLDLELVKENNKVKKDKSNPTDEQMNVINFNKGIARVNAGAGTGKTTTLILRTKRLLKENPEDKILMITFTNKGALELSERFGSPNKLKKYNLDIMTFNSFGSYVISKEYDKMNLKEDIKVVNNVNKISILLNLLNKSYPNIEWLNYNYPLLNMPKAKGVVYELISAFNYKKSFNKYPSKYDGEDDKIEVLDKIFGDFNIELNKNGFIDYQDQILLVIKLFKEHPELIQKYGYNHLTIDEGQDTDLFQIELLNQLREYKDFKSLLLVGDVSQAIYGFRNTTPEYMFDFKKHFGEFEDFQMTLNFRSTEQICKLGNKINILNTARNARNLRSFKGVGSVINYLKYNNFDEEGLNITKEIIKLHKEQNIALYDVAIISRTKNELLEMQKILNDNSIPNILDVPELNINNPNIRLLINLSKYFKNPNNKQYLLEYVLHVNKELITKEDVIEELELLHDIIQDNIEDDLDKLFDDEYDNDFRDEAKEQMLFQEYLKYIEPLVNEDIVCRKFVEDNFNFVEDTNISFVSNYLSKFVEYSDNSQINKSELKYNAVVLTTAHSSKGKEWDNLFVILDKFKYNETSEDDSRSQIIEKEEERRLLFVAVTRAKNNLFLTYHTNEDKKRDKGKYTKFVDELIN